MTCREKLTIEHPECMDLDCAGGCRGCPSTYNYLPARENCLGVDCAWCWDQEIPGTLPMQYPIDTAAEGELVNEPIPMWIKENPHVATIAGKNPEDDYCLIFIPNDGSYVDILGHRITGDFKTFEGFLEYLKDLEETIRNYEKLLAERQNVMDEPEKKEYHAPYPNLNIDIGCTIKDSGDRTQFETGDAIRNAAKAITEDAHMRCGNFDITRHDDGSATMVMSRAEPGAPQILDSGDRTQFETGAVRDMREGKGRCDLMPLEVVSDLLATHYCNRDPILHDIAAFKQENDTSWLMAALCNFATAAYDNYRTTMLLEVAKHFEEGAKKYGENNWQKGIPVHCYIDSAVRHYLKWLRGDKDEPHDRAFVWNLMCCIWEVDYHKSEEKTVETKLLPVSKATDMVRLGDLHVGLFDFGGDTYFKVNALAAPNFYVNVLTGAAQELHPDILVTPLEVREVGDGEEGGHEEN